MAANPARKKRRKPTGGTWTPDLFGGRGVEREGATRAEQLEIARDEMRRTGSGDLFDWLADQEPKRNPAVHEKIGSYTGCGLYNGGRYPRHQATEDLARVTCQRCRTSRNSARQERADAYVREQGTTVEEMVAEAWRKAQRADQDRKRNPWRKVALTTDKRGRPVAYIRTSNQPHRYIRIGYDEAKLELATGRATQEPFGPLGARRNPTDTPEMRYQRAVGHGERPATARTAAANPGRAVGRMAPNCPMCGALVRLPNPVPRTVTCHGCGSESMVRRP